MTVTAPAAAPVKPVLTETIRPMATLETLVSIDGDRVTIPKGSDLTDSEIALFIGDRADKARTFGSQARWTYYAAGMLNNGGERQKSIAEKLSTMLSKTALYQLTSEATTLCPLAIAEGIKAPLSVLKDAKAQLAINDKTGKLLPMAKQSRASKELIPLLKAGTVTQAAVRDIVKKHKAPTTSAPSKPTAKAGEAAEEAKAFGGFLASLNNANKYLEGNKVEGDDRAKALVMVTDICRKLGISLAGK